MAKTKMNRRGTENTEGGGGEWISLIIGLGLLVLLLVTTIMPAVAHTDFISSIPSVETRNFASLQNPKSKIQNPKSHSSAGVWERVEQGRTLFEAGRFAEAASVWSEAVAGFQREGDAINQAWSLSYLSLAYQNLGDWEKAKTAIANSLNLLHNENQHKKGSSAILAVALNTQGSLNIAMGQAEAALSSWLAAERAYAAAGDEAGKIGSQINQAQALAATGLYRRARSLLVSVNEKLQSQSDSLLKVKGLRSLGVVLQLVGDLQQSQEVLKQSLAISDRLGSVEEKSEILFSLGNASRDLQQLEAALNYYQQAQAATNPSIQVEALLNQLSLYIDTSQPQQAISLLPQIESLLNNLPPSRMSVYAAVNFARSLSILDYAQTQSKIQNPKSKIALVLASAVQQAKSLGDLRSQAHALNNLGHLYESTQQWAEALKLTQQALLIAQGINASDITYQVSWQLGRILKAKGDIQGATVAYDSAVKTLKSLRNDLVAINRDLQFSFQESVEPVYRELVDLLLQPSDGGISQNNLSQAREVIEALQLAELDNFFREACLNFKPKQIDQIDKQAAVIYPIILSDRLEVILSIPGQPLSSYKTFLPQAEVENIIKQTRQSLNPAFSNEERLQLNQKLYDWLIRPTESQLANSGIKTLAFVLDGSLRNLPMATLYNGKQYLVEKYSIALSPGLQLMQSQANMGEQPKVIAAGLSESRQGFQALPAVKSEVTEISAQVSSKLLLNEKFTGINLENTINKTPFSILHLATHGQFSSKSEQTFILTWNGQIHVKELDELLKSRNLSETKPVELLVLSACQTAKGDKRATLGLAGVAVRSGARSTLATLWAVNDDSTAKFMVEFYKQLKQPGIGKAEALRKSQLVFLQNSDLQHPYYWAPFVLVGNWL